MSNSDIAREVAAIIATHESEVSTGWHWRKGTVLFPEAKCPFCSSVIKSRAVWLVEDFYLRGQGVPIAGRPLVLDKPSHPHATPSAICMGDAVDPLQALFNGLNPKSSYFDTEHESHGGIPEWLRGPYWEHDCNEAREAEESESDDEYDCYCEACEQGMSDDDYYSFNSSYYCHPCWSDRAFYCEWCDTDRAINEMREGAGGEQCCDNCFLDNWFTCENCDDTKVIADRGCDDLCNECASRCNECSLYFDLDNEGSRCVTCNETYCDACEDGHTHEEPEPEPVVEPVLPTRRRRRRI